MSEVRIPIVKIENKTTEFKERVPVGSIVYDEDEKIFYSVRLYIKSGTTIQSNSESNRLTKISNPFTDALKSKIDSISLDLCLLGDLTLFNDWDSTKKQTFVTNALSLIANKKVCYALFADCSVIVTQTNENSNLFFIVGGNLYQIDITTPQLSFVALNSQPNWNENDNTKLSYINNRICYIDANGDVHKIDNQFLNVSQVALDGEYSSLLNKPTIPTKVSELNNDSEFATIEQVDTKIREQEATFISADESMVTSFEHCTYVGDLSSNLENGAWFKDGVECGATSGKYVTKNDYAIVQQDESVCFSVIHGFRYQRKKDGGATPFGYVELPDNSHTHAIIQQITEGTMQGALYFVDNSKVFSTHDLVFVITSLSVLTNAVIEFEDTIGGTILGRYDLSFPTTRYICSQSQTATKNPTWSFSYFVNDTTLTGGQLDVLNSGANSEKINQIETNKTNIATLQSSLDNKVEKVEGKGLSDVNFTQSNSNKLANIVDGACKVSVSDFRKTSGYMIGMISIWNTPKSTYQEADVIQVIYAPDIILNGNPISPSSSNGNYELDNAISGMFNENLGALKTEIYSYLIPMISPKVDSEPKKNNKTTLSATKYNDYGTLTESLSLSLPTITEGTYPEFNGEFTTDSNGSFGITFPVTMKGDTEYEASSTYWFSICNGRGIIAKVS